MRTFVDTNVWVYALDRGDPAKQAAALHLIREDPDAIVVSPQVMGELYVTLARLGAHPASADDAARAVDALRRCRSRRCWRPAACRHSPWCRSSPTT